MQEVAPTPIIAQPGKVSVLLLYTLKNGKKRARDMRHNVTRAEATTFIQNHPAVVTTDKNVKEVGFIVVDTDKYLETRNRELDA